ncbi:hypothetical protein H1C71_006286 [Ictidomys tridecemlineatus]|nr:hypothetical protein H1C71_006286 [Ictidomys tridecemlineatus]
MPEKGGSFCPFIYFRFSFFLCPLLLSFCLCDQSDQKSRKRATQGVNTCVENVIRSLHQMLELLSTHFFLLLLLFFLTISYLFFALVSQLYCLDKKKCKKKTICP